MNIESSFVLVSLKKIILIGLIGAFLTACASNKPEDELDYEADDTVVAEEPTVLTTPINEAKEAVVEDLSANLETIFYFGFDQSTLNSATRAALDAQAAYLRSNALPVRLEGHADERGSREYNLALGERRAKAVADYLAIQGVSRSRIEVVSYGEEQPLSLGSNESSYSENRRVELK